MPKDCYVNARINIPEKPDLNGLIRQAYEIVLENGYKPSFLELSRRKVSLTVNDPEYLKNLLPSIYSISLIFPHVIRGKDISEDLIRSFSEYPLKYGDLDIDIGIFVHIPGTKFRKSIGSIVIPGEKRRAGIFVELSHEQIKEYQEKLSGIKDEDLDSRFMLFSKTHEMYAKKETNLEFEEENSLPIAIYTPHGNYKQKIFLKKLCQILGLRENIDYEKTIGCTPDGITDKEFGKHPKITFRPDSMLEIYKILRENRKSFSFTINTFESGIGEANKILAEARKTGKSIDWEMVRALERKKSNFRMLTLDNYWLFLTCHEGGCYEEKNDWRHENQLCEDDVHQFEYFLTQLPIRSFNRIVYDRKHTRKEKVVLKKLEKEETEFLKSLESKAQLRSTQRK